MKKNFIVPQEALRDNGFGTYIIAGEPKLYVPSQFTAISPLDGRYSDIGKELSPYFSEFALVKNRVKVEVLFLKFQLDYLSDESAILLQTKSKLVFRDTDCLDKIYKEFSYEDFFEVKTIEEKINHDVKSVEIWVANQIEKLGLGEIKSYVHIGCTSEDITNPAYARMISDSLEKVWYPTAEKFINILENLSVQYKNVPMLAHTHGQPATPTTLGKELFVYVYRLRHALYEIKRIKILAKFNGATGNYAAINVAFPKKDWQKLAKHFVQYYLGLDFNPVTTQIESHDYIVEIASQMAHFNRICANFCSDLWTYISMEFFKQLVVKEEVGSSTMPNKVNPINFENGEMNFRKSTSDLEFLSEWLMSSRMQRDLRDSTALRNIGTAFGHSLLGLKKTISGVKRVEANTCVLQEKLNGKWEVLAEAIQTMLRKYGLPDAYNILKELTRGKNISREALNEFMNSDALSIVPDDEKLALTQMYPEDYTGLATKIVDDNI